MNTETNEAVVGRIRKLMAHANGEGATEAEVETYMAHARKLMDRFNIDEAAVLVYDEAARRSAVDSVVEESAFDRAGKVDRWTRQLAWAACNLCDVQFYTHFRQPRGPDGEPDWHESAREHVVFYGLPLDVAVAKAIYLELIATMRAMARFRLGAAFNATTYTSYKVGYVSRLIRRSAELKKASSAEAGTTAIVLAKDAVLNQWASRQEFATRRNAPSSYADRAAFLAGREDGERVSLDTKSVGHKAAPTRRLPGK